MQSKFLTLLFVAILATSIAQNTSNSPFSSFGIGEKAGIDHGIFTGIGNANLTYFDSTLVNFYNPATYNTLAQGMPIFSMGVTSRNSFYMQNNTSLFRNSTYVEHFVLGFTLNKYFGFSFGLKPFARKGYSIEDRVAVGSDSLKYSYLGTGGSNSVFLGLSNNLIKRKKTTLSVGANLGYLFGAATNERRSVLIAGNNLAGGIDWNALRLNAFHYELGAYFLQRIGKYNETVLTAVVEPSQKLQATNEQYLFSGIAGNPLSYDTIFTSIEKGSIQLAPTLSLGMRHTINFKGKKRNNSTRNSELSLHVNYASTDWSRYETSFNTNQINLQTTKLNIGVQFTPEYKFLENTVNTGFFETVRYRAGFYQYTLPYSVSGAQVNDLGTTFGFGIPILGQQSLSNVNFSVALGKRESGAANELQERYIGINLGICIAPSNFDKWFKKRKLD